MKVFFHGLYYLDKTTVEKPFYFIIVADDLLIDRAFLGTRIDILRVFRILCQLTKS